MIRDAALRRIEVGRRQPQHPLLYPSPHLGDRPLRGDADHLRKRERADRLN
jgi:hypothetical protein